MLHGRARFDLPPPIPGVSRVEVLPVLGCVLSGDLSVGHHLTEILGSCSRSLYAVRILKAHGLPTSSFHEVTRVTILGSKPAYYMPPLHDVASPQPRIAPELTVSSIKLLI